MPLTAGDVAYAINCALIHPSRSIYRDPSKLLLQLTGAFYVASINNRYPLSVCLRIKFTRLKRNVLTSYRSPVWPVECVWSCLDAYSDLLAQQIVSVRVRQNTCIGRCDVDRTSNNYIFLIYTYTIGRANIYLVVIFQRLR